MPAFNKKRISFLKDVSAAPGPVVYAMARDQRVEDNWALIYAQHLALEQKQPLIVACPLTSDYPEAPERQLDFMKAGLVEVKRRLDKLNIAFVSCDGPAAPNLSALIDDVKAGTLVCDFNPLRESRRWKSQLTRRVKIPVIEVDAHNIVPVWEASDKQEYAAYTIRPKINRQLSEFLEPFPALVKHPFAHDGKIMPKTWRKDSINGTANNGQALTFEPGASSAQRRLERFLSTRLTRYNDLRNDPAASGQSDLSPYLHFGQLSVQRVALEAQRYDDNLGAQEAFLEELIVRRELSDNFCHYNQQYDSFDGFPDWAQKTLNEHRGDPRPYLYNRDMLEAGETHDELWNAAQEEMVLTGKMHGYLRMYWAKKILEWSPSPEEALANAIYLNDKYELDGHDPNGYTGVAWSVGGVHDRAWAERDIFGKIRYMSYGGCKRKFSIDDYLDRVASLEAGVMS